MQKSNSDSLKPIHNAKTKNHVGGIVLGTFNVESSFEDVKDKDFKNLSTESPEKIEKNNGFNLAVLIENDYEVDPMFSAKHDPRKSNISHY